MIAALGGGCAAAPAPSPVVVPPVAAPVVVAAGPGCDGARLLPEAAVTERGPWNVGARTVHLEELTLEVWYPVAPPARAQHTAYDLRLEMPPREAAKIPDADNTPLPCECERDLPVDAAHGPYPVVVFFHGAASFRTQSTFLASHWASHGYVVIAPDLPGVGLAAVLADDTGFPLGVPLRVLDLVAGADPAAPADPLAFVRARIDRQRVALAGHSLGVVLMNTVVDRPEVRARIAMAGPIAARAGTTTLGLVGGHDHVGGGGAGAFDGELPDGTLAVVRLAKAGHLAFTDLCPLGADRGGTLAIARAHGVAVPEMVASLATDGCRPDDAPFAATAPVIRGATTAVLDEILRCDPAAHAAFARVAASPDVELVRAR